MTDTTTPPASTLQVPTTQLPLHSSSTQARENLGQGFSTTAIRAGLARTGYQETSDALFLTSGFVYDTAEDAEHAFSGKVDRHVYSRYSNPTIAAFEEKMRALEGAQACYATASGMSAVFVALSACTKTGDRIVASRSLFSSCYVILNEILPRWGITTEFVDGTDLGQWEKALSKPTAAVFFESPSNPLLEIVDIAAVSTLGHAAGARVIVDNVFATAVGQSPLQHGADVVVYSATKHIDGQGRVLGGAILGESDFINGPVKDLIRHTGPGLSPFNAWTLSKGLETLELRVNHASNSAHAIAQWLEARPEVTRVHYPSLSSHPQYELAQKYLSCSGTVVSFEFGAYVNEAGQHIDAKRQAFSVLNALHIFEISNNLGDAKSIATHPTSSTHRGLSPEELAATGLRDGHVRLSIGLENVTDLIGDLDNAFAAANATPALNAPPSLQCQSPTILCKA